MRIHSTWLIPLALLLGGGAPAPEVPTGPGAAGQPAAAGRGEPSLARLVGRVAYPGEYLPPMRVCALAKADPGTAYCLRTAENEPHYGISVPAGEHRDGLDINDWYYDPRLYPPPMEPVGRDQ